MTPPDTRENSMDRFDAIRNITKADALRRVSGPQEQRSQELFRHGSLQVKVYSPAGSDPQSPHIRDEAYVVIAGQGTFVSDAGRQSFEPGDFLFAPAGVPHRFEEFTSDFAVWVFFYGPEGGERRPRRASGDASV